MSLSTGKSARPSSNWTPAKLVGAIALTPTLSLTPTYLLEKDHSILGEAKLLKELWLVSDAKGYVQGILR